VFVKELWRYPVKSMAGERISGSKLTLAGFPDDRRVLVVLPNGRVITSRTHPRLLGLKGTVGEDGAPYISGRRWDSQEALQLVKRAAGESAGVLYYEGIDRFDVLPLLVASDGAIAHMNFDVRRFRPNIVIGDVDGLEERTWEGRRLRLGGAVIKAAQLRRRCIMTTYDPDTLQQDRSVLKRIVDELGGKMALDCAVVEAGSVREGDPVMLLDD
jgi:MOSC domain-containing protein